MHRTILFIVCSLICEIYSVDNCKKDSDNNSKDKKDINRKLVTVCYISKMDLSIKDDLPTFDHSQICAHIKQIEDFIDIIS